MSKGFDETTTDVVLDQRLFSRSEIYQKLREIKRKRITLSERQKDFLKEYEGTGSGIQSKNLPYKDE